MRQAIENGLVLESSAVEAVHATKSPYARLYDSRAGLASYYRYAPREIHVRLDVNKTRILPIIHGSVIMRLAHGSDSYAPISLPHEFWVLAPDGELRAMAGAPLSLKMDATKKREAAAPPSPQSDDAIYEGKAQLLEAIERLERPDREMVRFVWDTVFWRQCVYVLTAALSATLALYPVLGGAFEKGFHAFLRSTGVGTGVDDWLLQLVDRVNASSRGPITNIVDSVGDLIPSYAGLWIKSLEKYPLEFFCIASAILVGMVGGNVLKERIHDRARLAWTKGFGQGYADWLRESQKGTRNILVAALAVAIAGLVLVFIFGDSLRAKIDLGILVVAITALLGIRKLGRQPAGQSPNTPIPGTLALSLARFLRNNRLLNRAYWLLFDRIVPFLFALLLLSAGLAVVNRAMFDAVSAAGYSCKGSPTASADQTEKIGTSDQSFRTDQMCWPSGLVLQEGHRYRITLSTPGDWFDKTTRADVAGFSSDSILHFISTPILRWWTQTWFKPIARIGVVGNDEYVLTPVDPFEPHTYPQCPEIQRETMGGGVRAKIQPDIAANLMTCAQVPSDRLTVITDIRARSTGELFLYVNDAVLAFPGLADFFYRNNSGKGRITVEQITELPVSP